MIEKRTQSMETFYSQTLKQIREGDVVRGKIIAITPTEVLVDVGYKSEGAISLSEFSNPTDLKIGDEIDIYLEYKENDAGMIVLSKKKADRTHGWESIISQKKEGDVVEGKVLKKIKGGLLVDIGKMDAFLPSSLITTRGYANVGQLVGQTLKFVISKIDRVRKNIIISRRDYLTREKEESKQTLIMNLKPGDICRGVVKNITDFGAFIDIGGVDGLLHVTDISWGRVAHPSEILSVGRTIDVVVLEVDKERMKISLGLKQTTPSPWQKVESKYPVGSKVKGRVVNIMPYGVFVEVEKGLEGLVHISELSWTRRVNHPSEVLENGAMVEVVVLGVDATNQKLSLGLKQTEANPWEELARRYTPGTIVKGKIRNLTDYGAFVEIAEGVDGLLHVSDISWTKKVINPQDLFKKGDEIEVAVLSCDPKECKLSLGLKQLCPNPWSDVTARYPLGSIHEGKIAGIASFGIFVELEKDIEGLVRISEMDNYKSQSNLAESYKIGDRVKVAVLRIDEKEQKVALSMKTINA